MALQHQHADNTRSYQVGDCVCGPLLVLLDLRWCGWVFLTVAGPV